MASQIAAVIKNSSKCEVCDVISFFTAKNYAFVVFTEKFCTVYRPKVMNKRVVRESVIFFKNGQSNVHDEDRSGRLSVVIVEQVENYLFKMVMTY